MFLWILTRYLIFFSKFSKAIWYSVSSLLSSGTITWAIRALPISCQNTILLKIFWQPLIFSCWITGEKSWFRHWQNTFIPTLHRPILRIERSLYNTGKNKWFASDMSIAGRHYRWLQRMIWGDRNYITEITFACLGFTRVTETY